MKNRRSFIKQVAVGAGAVIAGNRLWGVPVATGASDKLGAIMPTRPFGKTGEQVTVYCMGGAHIGRVRDDGEDPEAIIDHAIESGVRFFDNAHVYSGGHAEELYGKYLTPKYRDSIFLMSKTHAKTRAEAYSDLDDSLRRMKTDYLDLWLMHNIKSPEDVELRLSEGAFEAFLEARQAGKVRYLGFSTHRFTAASFRMMEKVAGDDPFDYVQLPVNAVDVSKPDSFVTGLLPELASRGYAVGAMKTLAGGHFMGVPGSSRLDFRSDDPIIPNYISLEEALWFSLSQPITSIVSGTERLAHVKQNIDIAKRFAKLSHGDLVQIAERVSKFRMTPKLEYYRPDPRTMV